MLNRTLPKWSNKWTWTPAHREWLQSTESLQWPSDLEDCTDIRNSERFVLFIGSQDLELGGIMCECRRREIPFLAVSWRKWCQLAELDLSIKKSEAGISRFVGTIELGRKTWDWSRIGVVMTSATLPSYRRRVLMGYPEKSSGFRWWSAWDEIGFIEPTKIWPGPSATLGSGRQYRVHDWIRAESLGFKILTPKIATASIPSHVEKDFVRGREPTFGKYMAPPKLGREPRLSIPILPSVADIRACVIGDEVHAIRIARASTARGRNWMDQDIRKTPVLPLNFRGKEKRALINLVKSGGLQSATIDLLETKNGDLYFLEMNRPGTWLFMEALAGVPIISTYADMLEKSLSSTVE